MAYELGIRPETSAKPLRFGTNVHAGLDALGRGMLIGEAVRLATEDYGTLPSWVNTPEREHEWMIECVTVEALLCGYGFYWGGKSENIIYSEQSFDVPLMNPESGAASTNFTLAGKIDEVVRLTSGLTAIREHKTCSEDLQPGSDYWRRWKIDQQISLYYLAARQLGMTIDTVEIDAIRKPSIRPSLIPVLDDQGFKIIVDRDGNRVHLANGNPRQSGDADKGWKLQSRIETPNEYRVRLAADIASRPDWYYARQEIPRLESDLVEFEQELWQIQKQYAETRRLGRWFRNTAACRSFGKPCSYFDICVNGVPVGPEITPPAGFVKLDDVHPELVEE